MKILYLSNRGPSLHLYWLLVPDKRGRSLGRAQLEHEARNVGSRLADHGWIDRSSFGTCSWDWRWPVVERPKEEACAEKFVALRTDDFSSERERKMHMRSAALVKGSIILTDLNTLLNLDDKKLGEMWNSNTSIVNKG